MGEHLEVTGSTKERIMGDRGAVRASAGDSEVDRPIDLSRYNTMVPNDKQYQETTLKTQTCLCFHSMFAFHVP